MVSVDEIIDEARVVLTEGSLTDKILVVNALGKIADRRIYPILADQLGDEDLAPDVVTSLGRLDDSRASFPLMNLLLRNGQHPKLTQRILQYFEATADPRASSFLIHYMVNDDNPFKEIALSASRKCTANPIFTYQFAGNEEMYERALTMTGSIPLSNDGLNANKEEIDDNTHAMGFEKPQTYVILPDGTGWVGGYMNEHVDVAQGSDIIAVGEIWLYEENGLWSVKGINNRSNGYYPASSSFQWVRDFFKSSNVTFAKEMFDQIFPKRGFYDKDFLSIFRFGEHYQE